MCKANDDFEIQALADEATLSLAIHLDTMLRALILVASDPQVGTTLQCDQTVTSADKKENPTSFG